MLRVHRERPCRHRGAKERNEIAAPQRGPQSTTIGAYETPAHRTRIDWNGRVGSWPCENVSARRERRTFSRNCAVPKSNRTAHASSDSEQENCIFHILRMYEFLHSQGQSRSFGDVGSMSGLRESGHGSPIYENTPWHIGVSPASAGEAALKFEPRPLLGPREMSDLSPQSGPKRTFDQAALIFDLLDNPLPTTGATNLSSARRYLVEKLFE
jgi:hypothetical protein